MVIDQVPVRMDIDTGSGKSLTGKNTWKQSFPKKKLKETHATLITYSGEKLLLLGTCLVEVQHQGENHRVELLVADVTNQPPIIGRDWLGKIKIDWKGVRLEGGIIPHEGQNTTGGLRRTGVSL